jgi:hypothetical protein
VLFDNDRRSRFSADNVSAGRLNLIAPGYITPDGYLFSVKLHPVRLDQI